MAAKKKKVGTAGKTTAGIPGGMKAPTQTTIMRPPPGTYDPALDAQERAAGRGLGDFVLDTEQTRGRNLTDFVLGTQDIARQRTEFGEDIATERQGVETSFGRSLTDLLTERTQTGEDYTRNLSQLQRNFDILGSQQKQSINAAGLSSGGASAQAQRKRAENQAWEKAPIDTGFKRFGEASALAEGRLGEDKATTLAGILRSEGRGYGELDRAGGALNLAYERGDKDLTTGLGRAQRENTAFGLDIGDARQAQYGGPITAPVAAKSTAAAKKKKKTTIGSLVGKPVMGLGR